jgi:hypothetical protein
MNALGRMADVQLFLSTVTSEFRSYREELRRQLKRPNVDVHVQEDFISTGTETPDTLDSYIANCDAVIHLVGDMTGAWAPPEVTRTLRARYGDFVGRLPPLQSSLETDKPPLSYTQWEAYLAIYHGKRLVIALPEPGAMRDPNYRAEKEQQGSQQAHLERLRLLGRHTDFTFGNADQLAANVLRSSILDLLAEADRKQAARDRDEKQPNIGLIALLLLLAALSSWAAYSLASEKFFFILYAALSFAFSIAAVIRLRHYLRQKLGG